MPRTSRSFHEAWPGSRRAPRVTVQPASYHWLPAGLGMADDEHVAVLDDVLFAFQPQLALVARARVAAQIDHGLPVDDLGADELLLEVGVDGARGLDRRAVHGNGPGAALVLARGEKTHQAEQ